jgi:transposase
LLAGRGFELWIGDPARTKTLRVRKQKTNGQDAQLLLKLLPKDRFPWLSVPGLENRNLRQLLWRRHPLVQMTTRILDQLQTPAMNEGKKWKRKMWCDQGRAQLEKIPLAPWADRRRQAMKSKP